MARCSVCGAETRLYSNGVPLCNACSDALAAETKKKELETKPAPPRQSRINQHLAHHLAAARSSVRIRSLTCPA
jgi:hypothetical protein